MAWIVRANAGPRQYPLAKVPIGTKHWSCPSAFDYLASTRGHVAMHKRHDCALHPPTVSRTRERLPVTAAARRTNETMRARLIGDATLERRDPHVCEEFCEACCQLVRPC